MLFFWGFGEVAQFSSHVVTKLKAFSKFFENFGRGAGIQGHRHGGQPKITKIFKKIHKNSKF